MDGPPRDASSARPARRRSPGSAYIWSWKQLWLRAAAVLVLAGFLDAGVTYLLRWIDGRGVVGYHLGGGGPTVWWPIQAAVPEKVILALMLPILGLVAKRAPVRSLGDPLLLLIHLPVAAAFAVIHSALSIYVSVFVLIGAEYSPGAFRNEFFIHLAYYFVFDLLLFAAIIGAFYAFDYYEKWQKEASAASRLEASLARAHLDALRGQLNPHFLFNALNVISGLAMRRDPERAASMIADLSQLLRRALQIPAATVRLREELDFLRAYASIEQARMGDRLRIEIRAQSDILDARVPTLLIQPLIENAIKHGLAGRPGRGEVRVDVWREERRLRIRVRDTGAGFSRLVDGAVRPEEGVGLGNTRARLTHLYAGKASLVLSNVPDGGAQVQVDIPLQWWSVPPDEAPTPRERREA